MMTDRSTGTDPATAADGADQKTGALSEVLDQIEHTLGGDSVSVDDIVQALGQHSFASVMLVFSLICTSPASAIPGLTASVGLIVGIVVVQMMVGRKSLWLPGFILRREIPSDRLGTAIGWMRRPVRFVERFARPRFHILLHRPWLWLPMVLILGVALLMPVMEVVPTSGSIASAVIAIFATGLLTRDGRLVLAALVLLSALPLAIWRFGPLG
ncbi:MAG: exopolysaccharide biosynthesis protein [Cereibacter changlensis]